jgi:hypothetical protein
MPLLDGVLITLGQGLLGLVPVLTKVAAQRFEVGLVAALLRRRPAEPVASRAKALAACWVDGLDLGAPDQQPVLIALDLQAGPAS